LSKSAPAPVSVVGSIFFSRGMEVPPVVLG
jgi:hypothetical protein